MNEQNTASTSLWTTILRDSTVEASEYTSKTNNVIVLGKNLKSKIHTVTRRQQCGKIKFNC